MKKFIGPGIAVVIILILGFLSFRIVSPGYRGVMVHLGSVSPEPLGEGLHVVFPFITSIHSVNVQTQKLEMDSETYSKDLQVVSIKSALNYNLEPSAVTAMYREIGIDYEAKIIQPALEATVKQTIARYSAEDLLRLRSTVSAEIQGAIKQEMISSHIIVTQYQLVNETFSKEYEAAIEQKQVAEQQALQAKNKLDQVKFEAQQKIETAKADAESIKIQAEALAHNQELVKLKAVEKWDGKLPTYMMGNSVPFVDLAR